MHASPIANQQQKAHADLAAVLAGLTTEATIEVNAQTVPVLEEFLEMLAGCQPSVLERMKDEDIDLSAEVNA